MTLLGLTLVGALPGPLHDLVDNPSFRYGLKGGLVAAAVLALPGLLTGRLLRPDKGPAIGWAGLAPAVVVIVALHRLDGFARPGDGLRGFELGILALAVGGVVAALVPWRPFGVLCAAPGAAWICWPGLKEGVGTNRVIGFVVIVLVAPLLAEFDRRISVPGLAVLLVAGSIAGLYVTLPDTEKAALVLGVAIPVGLVGWPLGLAHLGAAGSFPFVGAAVWVAERSGPPRPGSIVGALGTFAFVAVAPLVWRFRPGRPPPGSRGLAARTAEWSPWVLGVAAVVAQGLVVTWASRVAGLRTGRQEAVALMVPAVVVAAWMAAVLPTLGPAGTDGDGPIGRRRGERVPDHAALGPARRGRVRERVPFGALAEPAALGPAHPGRVRQHAPPVAVGPDHPALGPAVTLRRAAGLAARDVSGGPAHDAALSALADPLASMFSRPSRRLVVTITALWCVAAVPGLAVLTHHHLRAGAVAEAVSYLALALGLASVTGVRHTFARVSRLPAAVLVSGAVLVTFGQLGGGGRHVFPLVRFNVYTDAIPDDAADFTNLEGVTSGGERVLLKGNEVFHSLENGRFESEQAHLLSASGIGTATATDGRHDDAVDDYRRFALSLLRQYNAEHPARPIVSLDVVAYDAPDVPELADHRADVTPRVLISVRSDGTSTIPPAPAGATTGAPAAGASGG